MRLLASACAVAAVAITLTGCKKTPPANVAAQVNSRAITFSDIDKQLELQFAGAQDRPTGEELTIRKLELLRTLVDSEIMLQRAEKLGADFAVLGPVQVTPTHPGVPTLGWEEFAALIRDCPLPVFALGGMRPRDLPRAWRAGAHGISMLRGAW